MATTPKPPKTNGAPAPLTPSLVVTLPESSAVEMAMTKVKGQEGRVEGAAARLDVASKVYAEAEDKADEANRLARQVEDKWYEDPTAMMTDTQGKPVLDDQTRAWLKANSPPGTEAKTVAEALTQAGIIRDNMVRSFGRHQELRDTRLAEVRDERAHLEKAKSELETARVLEELANGDYERDTEADAVAAEAALNEYHNRMKAIRNRNRAVNAKLAPLQAHLPRDADGYPTPPPYDGSKAAGYFAKAVHERGGAMHDSRNHHELIWLFNEASTLRGGDPWDFVMSRAGTNLYFDLREAAKKSPLLHSKLPRFSEVAMSSRCSREVQAKWEALDRADYSAMQAEGMAAAEVRRTEAVVKHLHQQIRQNGRVVERNGKPVNPPETEGEIIEAAPDVPVDPAIAYEYDTTKGNPDRSPQPSAKAAPLSQSTQRVAAKMTPAQNAELGAVLAIRAAQIAKAAAAPRSAEGELGGGNTVLGPIVVPGVGKIEGD